MSAEARLDAPSFDLNWLVPVGPFEPTLVLLATPVEFAYQMADAAAHFIGSDFAYEDGWPCAGALHAVILKRRGVIKARLTLSSPLDWSTPAYRLFVKSAGVFNSPFLPALCLRARIEDQAATSTALPITRLRPARLAS